jgi:hypothetical protein
MSSSRGRKLKPKSISPTTVTPTKKKRPNTVRLRIEKRTEKSRFWLFTTLQHKRLKMNSSHLGT